MLYSRAVRGTCTWFGAVLRPSEYAHPLFSLVAQRLSPSLIHALPRFLRCHYPLVCLAAGSHDAARHRNHHGDCHQPTHRTSGSHGTCHMLAGRRRGTRGGRGGMVKARDDKLRRDGRDASRPQAGQVRDATIFSWCCCGYVSLLPDTRLMPASVFLPPPPEPSLISLGPCRRDCGALARGGLRPRRPGKCRALGGSADCCPAARRTCRRAAPLAAVHG